MLEPAPPRQFLSYAPPAPGPGKPPLSRRVRCALATLCLAGVIGLLCYLFIAIEIHDYDAPGKVAILRPFWSTLRDIALVTAVLLLLTAAGILVTNRRTLVGIALAIASLIAAALVADEKSPLAIQDQFVAANGESYCGLNPSSHFTRLAIGRLVSRNIFYQKVEVVAFADLYPPGIPVVTPPDAPATQRPFYRMTKDGRIAACDSYNSNLVCYILYDPSTGRAIDLKTQPPSLLLGSTSPAQPPASQP